jgi:hypothetical protein
VVFNVHDCHGTAAMPEVQRCKSPRCQHVALTAAMQLSRQEQDGARGMFVKGNIREVQAHTFGLVTSPGNTHLGRAQCDVWAHLYWWCS